MSEREFVVELPARNIGQPDGLSDSAVAFLASYKSGYEQPDLSDIQGWRDLVACRNAAAARSYPAVLARLGVQLESERIGGVPVQVGTPPRLLSDREVILDFHGGGYLFQGGDEAVRFRAAVTAARMGRKVISVDYRMAPDHAYPAGLDDAVATYRALLASRPAHEIVISGLSAGAGLATALLMRLREEGLPQPSGAILLSPHIDLTCRSDTFFTLDGLDPVLCLPSMPLNRLYAGNADLEDPMLSPLFGDVGGFPPTFLQAGGRDLFLSSTLRFHRKLRNAGIAAELHVWDGMPHGGFGGGTPEDREVTMEIRAFLASLSAREGGE